MHRVMRTSPLDFRTAANPPAAIRLPASGRTGLLVGLLTLACLAGGCQRPASESATPDAGKDGPSLFFTVGDLEDLRDKVKQEPAASMYVRLIARAEETLPVSEKPVVLKTPIDGRVWSTRVIDTAFAAHLTGRDDLMLAAIRLLCSAAEQYTPDDYYAVGTSRDLFVGNMAEGMAKGYDLARGHLTPEQDALLRNHTEDIGAYIYAASTTGKAGNTDAYHFFGEEREARFASNWNTVTHGNLGLCALVLDSHPEWIELANKRILGYLKYSNDATGAPYEGAAYLGYGKQNAFGYIVALKRLRGIDLLDSEEAAHLKEISRWMVHHTYPWGSGLVPINQSGDALSQSDWFLHLCSRFQDRVGQWAFLRLFGDKEQFGGDGTYGAQGHPGHSSRMMPSILWVDNNLEPLSPAEAGWPLSQRFERGQVAARSGWEAQDSLFTLTSGRGIGGVWNHADENSFTFYACGEAFSIDPGPSKQTADWHNVVLVDGKGQDGDGGPHATQGVITAFEDVGDTVKVTGQANTAYLRVARLVNAQRRITYHRSSETPSLLIEDQYLKIDGTTGDFVWQMFTAEGNKAELLPDEKAVLITGANGKGVCKVTSLGPDDAVWSLEDRDELPLLKLSASKGTFRVKLEASRISQ